MVAGSLSMSNVMVRVVGLFDCGTPIGLAGVTVRSSTSSSTCSWVLAPCGGTVNTTVSGRPKTCASVGET